MSRAVCSSTADTTLLCSSSVGCGWVVCPMCTLSLSTHCCQHFYRSSICSSCLFCQRHDHLHSIAMHGREKESQRCYQPKGSRIHHQNQSKPWQGSCWKIIGMSYSGWGNVMWWCLIHIMRWGRPQENILEVNRSIFPLNICWMWTYMIHTSCISGKGLTRTQEVKSPKTEIYSIS